MSEFREGYVYRLYNAADWQAIEFYDVLPYAAHDTADGFLHLSAPAQVLETARLHYKDHSELVAAGIKAEQLSSGLKWEEARGGQSFPHMYGDVALDVVSHILKLVRQDDGSFAVR